MKSRYYTRDAFGLMLVIYLGIVALCAALVLL